MSAPSYNDQPDERPAVGGQQVLIHGWQAETKAKIVDDIDPIDL